MRGFTLKIKFTKMHSSGNDYVYINGFLETINNPSELSQKISQRHFSIGSDGLIIICPSEIADVQMKMFNPDGSESKMCGNGLRCVAKFASDHILSKNPTDVTVESHSEVYKITLLKNSKNNAFAKINMGKPKIENFDIPVKLEENQTINHTIEILDKKFDITYVEIGNPHVVIYLDEIENLELDKYGPLIENYKLFPERTNVEFVKIVSKDEVNIRVWERGTGETLSCGSGASAVCIAGVLTKQTSGNLKVNLKGGPLEIKWNSGEDLFLSGPCEEVFTGEIEV